MRRAWRGALSPARLAISGLDVEFLAQAVEDTSIETVTVAHFFVPAQ